MFSLRYFNPRSRVGNDDNWGTFDNARFNISIHVPAWGTTVTLSYDNVISLFQSTFPRGERPLHDMGMLLIDYFNPRSRVGNDKVVRHMSKYTTISIHVPAWGTTLSIGS